MTSDNGSILSRMRRNGMGVLKPQEGVSALDFFTASHATKCSSATWIISPFDRKIRKRLLFFEFVQIHRFSVFLQISVHLAGIARADPCSITGCRLAVLGAGGVPTCWTKAQGTVQNPIMLPRRACAEACLSRGALLVGTGRQLLKTMLLMGVCIVL